MGDSESHSLMGMLLEMQEERRLREESAEAVPGAFDHPVHRRPHRPGDVHAERIDRCFDEIDAGFERILSKLEFLIDYLEARRAIG